MVDQLDEYLPDEIQRQISNGTGHDRICGLGQLCVSGDHWPYADSKLMDMQHQNQQASRYIWQERTVWFDEGEAPDESVQSSDEWESRRRLR